MTTINANLPAYTPTDLQPEPGAAEQSNVNRTTGQSGINGINDAGIFSLQSLVLEYEKMCAQNRETYQQAAVKQKVSSIARRENWYGKSMDNIDKQHDADMLQAGMQIAGGVVQLFGATAGGLSKNSSDVATHASSGLSKSLEGIGGVQSAGLSREARELQVEGDAEKQLAEEHAKAAGEYDQQMSQASRDMAELTRAINQLYGQLAQAVKY